MATIIDTLYENGRMLVSYLTDQKELALATEAENSFRKTLLLSSASFFEKEITEILIEFAKSRSSNDELLVSFVRFKALGRDYFRLFTWEGNNANTFFSFFGDSFKTHMVNRVKQESDLEDAIKSFLQLGLERNKLVHQNFAEIVLDKTAEEVYTLYKKAQYFVQTIRGELIPIKNNQIYEVIETSSEKNLDSKFNLCNFIRRIFK